MNEFIYKWDEALRKTTEGGNAIAIRVAEKLKEDGFTSEETYDLMIADNFTSSVIESAVKNAYVKEAQVVQDEFIPMVVPTSYTDVKPIIEESLKKYSSKEFINKLVKSEYAIMTNYPDKQRISLANLVANAKTDNYALQILHKELLPFIENKMYESVLTAEQNTKLAISEPMEGRFIVASSTKNNFDVSLENGTCTCDKYTKGNYADFGLACEHLVAVANSVSPNRKLIRGSMI
jgi:hypothetical protein